MSSSAPSLKRQRLFEHDPETLRKLSTKMVLPGDLVGYKSSGLLKGRGLIEDSASGAYRACIAGYVQRVDRYVSVQPVFAKTQYAVGDVIVGRIAEVQNGRWAVDVGMAKPAVLHLANISLPNNEQRRRTAADNLQIREYFKEKDLIVAEIQRIQAESGDVLLQTRSAKYGLLKHGVLVKVPASLVRRDRSNMVRIGVTPGHLKHTGLFKKDKLCSTVPKIHLQLILAANGWVFVSRAPKQQGLGGAPVETQNSGNKDVVPGAGSQEDGSDDTIEDAVMQKTICDFQTLIGKIGALGLEVASESIEKCYNEVSTELAKRCEVEAAAGSSSTVADNENDILDDDTSLNFNEPNVTPILLEKIRTVCWKKTGK